MDPRADELIKLVEVDGTKPTVYDWAIILNIDQPALYHCPYSWRNYSERGMRPQRFVYIGTGADTTTLESIHIDISSQITQPGMTAQMPLSVFDHRYHPMHFTMDVIKPRDYQINIRVITTTEPALGRFIIYGVWHEEPGKTVGDIYERYQRNERRRFDGMDRTDSPIPPHFDSIVDRVQEQSFEREDVSTLYTGIFGGGGGSGKDG